MSSIPSSSIRPEISSVLGKLRTKIQTYLLFHGLALAVVVLCCGFFFTLGFDWLHFQLRKLELPVGFRAFLGLVVVGVILWVLSSQVVQRLLRSKQNRSLALILERRFPALNDRLITAVELGGRSERSPQSTALSEGMLQNTIAAAAQSADGLQLGDVFDWKPLIRACTLGAFLLCAIVATAIGAPAAFDRWQRAFIHFDEVYWIRETNLEVFVLSPPNDRERPLSDAVYKHAKGSDLRLLVRVPENRGGGERDWVVPEGVDIEYRLSSNRGVEVKPLARRGDREFQFKLAGLHDSMEFWISGNDFVNRTPFRIEVVAPPVPERIVARCDYAPYTQLNDESLDDRALSSKHIEVPDETFFVLDVATNKPLRNIVVQAGPYEFSLGKFSAQSDESAAPTDDSAAAEYKVQLTSPGSSTPETVAIPANVGAQYFTVGQSSFRIPFVMSRRTKAELAERSHRLPKELGVPWLLSELTEFKIYLEDHDGIVSAEPVKFTMGGVLDEPPVVEVELQGIDTSITRLASIPMRGLITDDYGISVAVFEFKIDAEEAFRPRAFRNPPGDNPLEFRLKRSETEAVERFEVLPLDLEVGQQIILTVYARDADNINGPHESRGQVFTFKIVTREELLGILYEREINLRRQFEQIISEIERTKKDLQAHHDIAVELDQLRAAMTSGTATADAALKIDEGRVNLSNCAERSLHQIGKNRGETAAILDSYRKILEELVNNGVNTRQMNERLDDLILKPLTAITEIDFPHTDESIGLFRQANQNNEDPKPRIDQSMAALDEMLLHMKQVLKEMSDLAELHEMIKDLKKIFENQIEVKDETEEERKNSLKDKLKDLGL